jgi:hypothetical protein
MPPSSELENRILLLARRGRDAPVIARILERHGHGHLICEHATGLADGMAEGAAMAIVTEESLIGDDCGALISWLADQPPWSDFPFILLATKRSGRRPPEATRLLERLGNVVVLERIALVSVSAWIGRSSTTTLPSRSSRRVASGGRRPERFVANRMNGKSDQGG